MMVFWQRFWQTPFFIRLTGLLCVLGVLVNLGLIGRDIWVGSVLVRLHIGFLLLYIGQVIFIAAQERYVCVLTVLQGVAALLTTADFIFTPVLQLAGLAFWITVPSLEAQSVYQYLFMSAAFTLQMAGAAYLWFYFKHKE